MNRADTTPTSTPTGGYRCGGRPARDLTGPRFPRRPVSQDATERHRSTIDQTSSDSSARS